MRIASPSVASWCTESWAFHFLCQINPRQVVVSISPPLFLYTHMTTVSFCSYWIKTTDTCREEKITLTMLSDVLMTIRSWSELQFQSKKPELVKAPVDHGAIGKQGLEVSRSCTSNVLICALHRHNAKGIMRSARELRLIFCFVLGSRSLNEWRKVYLLEFDRSSPARPTTRPK